MEKFKKLTLLALTAVFSLFSLSFTAAMALASRDTSEFAVAQVAENDFVTKVAKRN